MHLFGWHVSACWWLKGAQPAELLDVFMRRPAAGWFADEPIGSGPRCDWRHRWRTITMAYSRAHREWWSTFRSRKHGVQIGPRAGHYGPLAAGLKWTSGPGTMPAHLNSRSRKKEERRWNINCPSLAPLLPLLLSNHASEGVRKVRCSDAGLFRQETNNFKSSPLPVSCKSAITPLHLAPP